MAALSEQKVIITGGGTGIGKAIAHAFAEAGCSVLITGRREDKLQEAALEFQGKPVIKTFVCDVSNRTNVAELFEAAHQQMGRVDILVNSAGINIPNRSIETLNPDDWDKLIAVNATGAYNTIYSALPAMREQKNGLIINISSVSGIRANLLGGVAYNASKYAMAALGLTVAQEVKDFGIRVTNIYPGEVETPILDNRLVPLSAEQRARILQPEDIAATVMMVAKLPPRAHIPELSIMPTSQSFV